VQEGRWEDGGTEPAGVWQLSVSWYRAPSLTRGCVCIILVFISPRTGEFSLIPGCWFPSCRLSRLVGLRWKYSIPPLHGTLYYIELCYISSCSTSCYFATDSQSASPSYVGNSYRCRTFAVFMTTCLTRGRFCNLLAQFAITLPSKSPRTHHYKLLSHLRLPQPEGPGFSIYILPRTRRSNYTFGHCIPFPSPLTTGRATEEVF
jgi:hypothetical protein